MLTSRSALCACQLPVDQRPPTPRKKTRSIRVGQDIVDKEFKSLVEGHNMDVQAMKVRWPSRRRGSCRVRARGEPHRGLG